MKNIIHNWPIYVGWSPTLNCRGILALRDLKKGELIEPCPLILIKHRSHQTRINGNPTDSLLDNYYYDWNRTHWCIPLGYGVLYNHSYHPNARYVFDHKNELINYVAIRDIKKGEEIFINYNGVPDDLTPIDDWFHEYSGKTIK